MEVIESYQTYDKTTEMFNKLLLLVFKRKWIQHVLLALGVKGETVK